jgi:hypothetical protein
VILRCTAKLLSLLGQQAVDAAPSADDWYANLLWIERRKCLLLTHASTLFPIVVLDVQKAAITPFGPFVRDLVGHHLADERLPSTALGPLDETLLAGTASRSVLAVMNQSATHIRYRVAAMGGVARSDERIINRSLRRTPHERDGSYVTALGLVAARV